MLNGGAGNDQLHGGTGDDGFFGGGGNDFIYGDAGSDTIYGDGGNDVIDGGTGDDTLVGGSGSDTFAFKTGAGSDHILDFQAGYDRLDFSAMSSVNSMSDLEIVQTGAKSVEVSYFDGVNNVTLEIESNSPITLGPLDFTF